MSELLTIRSRDAGKFWVISCCIDNGFAPPPPPPAFLSRVLSFLASDFDFSFFFSSFFFSSFFFSSFFFSWFFFSSRDFCSFILSCFGSSFFIERFSAFFLLFSLGLFLLLELFIKRGHFSASAVKVSGFASALLGI